MDKKIGKKMIFYFAVLSIGFSQPAFAASKADIDKMTTYAVVLGRTVACGAKIEKPMQQVSKWFDKRFTKASGDNKRYLPIFAEAITYNAQEQKEGRSPDTCAAVLKVYRDFPWP